MLQVPKELKGKQVQKFEDLDDPYFVSTCDNCGCGVDEFKFDWLDFRRFYTQPFSPEMIEKYFVDIEKTDFATWLSKNDDLIYFDGIWYFEPSSEIEFTYHIKTLSDFVDACLNSEIELKWRD